MPPPRLSQRTTTLSTPPRKQAPHKSTHPFCAHDTQFTPTLLRRIAPQPSPRREASPRREKSPIRTQSNNQNYDPKKVGHTRRDSLGILNTPVSTAATEREIKLQYWRLAIL